MTIIGIGLKLLDIKDVKVGNFLPALVIAPALVGLVSLFEAALYGTRTARRRRRRRLGRRKPGVRISRIGASGGVLST